MKNIVYVSPHFPNNYRHFSTALKKAGARVLGLGDEAFDKINPELKDAFTEYYKVKDMHNYEELLKACGFFTYKYGKIFRIDSHNEYWLKTEAKLRDDFNVYGLKTNDINKICLKSEMKKIYRKLGFKVAAGKTVETILEAEEFIKENGYPVILKPNTGVGASNTYKIKSHEDLESTFKKSPKVDFIIEEFIEGQIHSFDGLSDKNCEPVLYTSHIFNQGIMEIVSRDANIHYYSVKEVPQKLKEMGEKCLKAFNIRERFFHLEFFLTPKGEYIPLEINIRPPGGLSTDMINYACDVNIYQVWADLLVNDKTDLTYTRKYHCMYVGRKAGNHYTYTHNNIINKYSKLLITHQEMSSVFRSALGDYAYILRSEEKDVLLEAAEFIHQEQE